MLEVSPVDEKNLTSREKEVGMERGIFMEAKVWNKAFQLIYKIEDTMRYSGDEVEWRRKKSVLLRVRRSQYPSRKRLVEGCWCRFNRIKATFFHFCLCFFPSKSLVWGRERIYFCVFENVKAYARVNWRGGGFYCLTFFSPFLVSAYVKDLSFRSFSSLAVQLFCRFSNFNFTKKSPISCDLSATLGELIGRLIGKATRATI